MPGVSEILSAFFYASVAPPFCFTTRDSNFDACGSIVQISEGNHYKEYKERFPKRDHTLYRYNRTRDWKYFFMWRIFLTDANWRTPYLRKVSQGL